jgi:drug/metabolite transporter (DMT)-like permease
VELVVVATIGIAVLLILINFSRSKLPPLEGRHLRFYVLAGLFGFGAPFLLECLVAPHLPALLFVIIVTSTPIWTVFIATSLRLEKASWLRIIGVIGGFVATALVIIGTLNPVAAEETETELVWAAAAFGIPILYAVYILYIAAAWPSDLDNLQGAQGQSTVALAAFLIFWLILPARSLNLEAMKIDWSMMIIVIAEVVALVLLFHLARNHGGSFTAQANYVAVAVGTIISILFFNEQVSVIATAGVVLLIVALRLSAATAR